MKKRFLAETLLVLMLLCSCSTTDSQSIAQDCLLEAEEYYTQNNIQQAVECCQDGYSKTKDYRLLYNQAIYTALSGDFHQAAELSLEGYKTFPDKKEFLNAALKYLESGKELTLLYEIAIGQWDSGNTSKEIIHALYTAKPEEWTNLYNALNN